MMADIELTQAEADDLIKAPKVKVDDSPWMYSGQGDSLRIPLTSEDRRENFMLDISRGRIEVIRGKYQMRGHHIIILVRLDFGGALHRNPDGLEIPCPHLHLYREGYGDKWAYQVPSDSFSNLTDLWQTLNDFMRYCNIVDPPNIQQGLFV